MVCVYTAESLLMNMPSTTVYSSSTMPRRRLRCFRCFRFYAILVSATLHSRRSVKSSVTLGSHALHYNVTAVDQLSSSFCQNIDSLSSGQIRLPLPATLRRRSYMIRRWNTIVANFRRRNYSSQTSQRSSIAALSALVVVVTDAMLTLLITADM